MEQSINQIQCVGSISELNFKIEENKEVELKGANGVTKKVVCNQIGKNNYSSPNITINCGDNVVGFSFFATNEKMIKDGKVVDNPKYKALLTIMDYDMGTRVKVDGSFADNSYPNKDGEWKEYIGLNAFRCTSTNVPDEDYCDCDLSGVIESISNEYVDDEDTGRLKVKFDFFDYGLNLIPIELIVDSDLAEDFEDAYEKGDSAILHIEIKSVLKGGKTTKSEGGFGRASKKTSGWVETEYRIFGGEPKMEEENKNYVSMETVKEKKKERELMAEQKCKDRKESAPSTETKKGLGNRASKKSEVKDDDPFSDDDF